MSEMQSGEAELLVSRGLPGDRSGINKWSNLSPKEGRSIEGNLTQRCMRTMPILPKSISFLSSEQTGVES